MIYSFVHYDNIIYRSYDYTVCYGDGRHRLNAINCWCDLGVCSCTDFGTTGVLFTHEHLLRANVEHILSGLRRRDSGHHSHWLVVDHGTSESQYVDGSLIGHRYV